jgi:hypothetical protein
MVWLLVRISLAGLAAVPLLGQQLRLPSVTRNSNALDRAIHSFVTKNANLPPVVQPQKPPQNKVPWSRQSPKRILIERDSNRVCSMPLTNLRPPVDPNDLNMPRVAPRDIDRMPNIVPAPPCTN